MRDGPRHARCAQFQRRHLGVGDRRDLGGRVFDEASVSMSSWDGDRSRRGVRGDVRILFSALTPDLWSSWLRRRRPASSMAVRDAAA